MPDTATAADTALAMATDMTTPTVGGLLTSPELEEAISALESVAELQVEPTGNEATDLKVTQLSAALDSLRTDGETLRKAVHDYALPGLQAASIEQTAAVSGAAAPVVAGATSSSAMLATALEMLNSIPSDTGLRAGGDDEIPGSSGDAEDSEDKDGAAPEDGSEADGETVADTAPAAGGSGATDPSAVTTQTTGAAPSPTALLSALAASPAPMSGAPTMNPMLGGMSPMYGMPGMSGYPAAQAATPATTPTTTSSASTGGITRAELQQMVSDAKERAAARSASSHSAPAASSPPASSPVSPAPTSTSTAAPTITPPATSSPAGSSTAGTPATAAPAAPATGKTVVGGVVDQTSAARPTAATTLSHATGGTVASAKAPSGGGMGMGMMPPMGAMGAMGAAGAGAGAAGAGSKSGNPLDEFKSTNPVITGEWARRGSVSGGAVPAGRHRADDIDTTAGYRGSKGAALGSIFASDSRHAARSERKEAVREAADLGAVPLSPHQSWV